MTYVTGFLTPVKTEVRERYIRSAEVAWPFFQRHGCLKHMETWGVDIADGHTTDFNRAVLRQEGEAVVLAWLIWPDKATADAAWAAMMEDPAMQNMDMPFDGKRMMWGGFETIFERSSG
jgi:uncharacterized protein YbaA (DUF1428 family)